MMLRAIAPLVLCLGVMNDQPALAQGTSPPTGIEEVSFVTDDGVTVFGDLYRAGGDDDRTLILLLHQSASNSAEYYPIAPGLVALGYHCLALDARGGGKGRGSVNRTVARLPEHGGGPEAYHDFKAALTFVRSAGFTGKIVMWGSSYSGGRMFQLLAEQPEGVVAGLSFSPGAAFARRGPDGELSWAEQVQIPIFMTWAESELDDDRRGRFARIASDRKVMFEQNGGVHASSTLHPDENSGAHREVWRAVVDFLADHAPTRFDAASRLNE